MGPLEGPLETTGWAHNGHGEFGPSGQPQGKDAFEEATFTHSQELHAADVWRMRFEAGQHAVIGLAGVGHSVEEHEETFPITAVMDLITGTTCINSGLSLDGQQHLHHGQLRPYIPKAPFDLALRCEEVSNVPQIQFNDDGVWRDFAPDRAALKAGLWFPYLDLYDDARLSNHHVHRPRSTKSAGMKRKCPNPAPESGGRHHSRTRLKSLPMRPTNPT